MNLFFILFCMYQSGIHLAVELVVSFPTFIVLNFMQKVSLNQWNGMFLTWLRKEIFQLYQHMYLHISTYRLRFEHIYFYWLPPNVRVRSESVPLSPHPDFQGPFVCWPHNFTGLGLQKNSTFQHHHQLGSSVSSRYFLHFVEFKFFKWSSNILLDDEA